VHFTHQNDVQRHKIIFLPKYYFEREKVSRVDCFTGNFHTFARLFKETASVTAAIFCQ